MSTLGMKEYPFAELSWVRPQDRSEFVRGLIDAHIEPSNPPDETTVVKNAGTLTINYTAKTASKTEDTGLTVYTISPIVMIVSEAKKRILHLEEDWDDEGWPAYEKKTLDDAAAFLYRLDTIEAKKVRILPASGGSIDLHWKTEKFEFLINFSPDGSVDYYGDDYSGNLIQGKAHPKPEFIACWMKHTSE